MMLNCGKSSADEFQKQELSKKLVRKTYLITDSRANESIIHGRETFSRLILESFQRSKSFTMGLYAGSHIKVKAYITTCASSLIVIKDGVVQNNIW